MKISDSELARLRNYPQSSRLWLGVQQGVTVLSGTVDGDQVEGETEIPLRDVTVADTSDLLRGMTVAIGNETQDRRVDAVFLSYDDGTLTVTLGPNALQINDGQILTVYTAFKLWRVPPPAWDGSQHLPPFAIMGSPRAGFVGEPLSFTGDNSYSPVGRTITDYAWKKFGANLISGSLSVANTEDSPLELSWDSPGEYLVRLRVTDDAGEIGKSIRPILMFERDGENAPYSQFTISNFKYSGQGWSADVTVFGDADNDTFPRQGLIVVWAEDWYDLPVEGEQGSIGGEYRGASEVVYCGWIRAGSVLVSAEENSVTFTMDSAETQMQGLAMPGRTFRDGDDSTNWYTFDTLTLDKALLHIVQQETTLPLMSDVFVGLFGYQYAGPLDVPQAALYDQLSQSILSACFGYIAGSRFGSVTLARHRNMLTAAQRAYLNTASIQFTTRDWFDLKTNGDNQSGTAQVFLEGQLGDATPVIGKYPATGPSRNGEIRRQPGFLFLDQDQANELAKVLWQHDNRAVNASNGLTLRLPNYRVLEPAFEEYATIILLASENTRGINWDNVLNGDQGREVLATGASIDFSDNAILVTYDFTVSVYGAQGRNWTLLDPAPTLEFMYGYGQAAVTPGSDVDYLLDSDGDRLLDSEGVLLVDSL